MSIDSLNFWMVCTTTSSVLSYLVTSRGNDLKEWVASLGLGAQIADINFDANLLEEFRDG